MQVQWQSFHMKESLKEELALQLHALSVNKRRPDQNLQTYKY